MQITTPADIQSIAWEGELTAPDLSYAMLWGGERPVVTLGRVEAWPAAEALESETGKKWSPPLGSARYWLVRLACTLHAPSSPAVIQAARQELILQGQPRGVDAQCVYAHSLYPVRLEVESNSEFNVGLGPELGFVDGSSIKVGEVGAKIEYRKVFPVIQGFGVGETSPYWEFNPHAAHPLVGSQCVYAVLAARSPAKGIRGHVEVTVNLQTAFGPLKFGLPREAREHTLFKLP